MLGVLLFWIWADGGIWKCSDLTQDERYNHLVRSHLNFDLFRECRPWPKLIKDLLQKTLSTSPSQRLKLDELEKHRWWAYDLSEDEQKSTVYNPSHSNRLTGAQTTPGISTPKEGSRVPSAPLQRGGQHCQDNWRPTDRREVQPNVGTREQYNVGCRDRKGH
eukprot:GHVS01071774.1.p1 GENE.GHVS01071774.1~~GHVS01071774.1.p1  ORF type:complete len:162 (-),score=18.59 GHVS01071774.1:243-728(-)